jgi:hypothetical protein
MGYYVYFSKYKQEFDMLNAYICIVSGKTFHIVDLRKDDFDET